MISSKGSDAVQTAKLLEQIKTHALLGGEQLLAHMFSAVDDLFYDLSKRASSNQEANLYFEAMRDIRMGREGAAKRFLYLIGKGFSKLLDMHELGGSYSLDEEPVTLAIIDGEDMEIDLARTTMISRARALYSEELHELCARLDLVVTPVPITEQNNPLDPQQLADAFVDACNSKLSVNLKGKLIVLKMFEKHLLGQMGNVYRLANQVLIDAGILPKVARQSRSAEEAKYPVHTRPQAGAAMAAPATRNTPAAPFSLNPAALGILMAAARNASYGSSHQGRAPAINCYIYTANPGPVMPHAELSQLLTLAQQKIEQTLSSDLPRNMIGEIVSDLLASNDAAEPQALQQADEDVINLVALFFDEVLADENLPIAVQSLVCRLQIPILKVAMRDSQFFDEENHPARQLINGITGAGLELDDTKPLDKDPVYLKMFELVQHINHYYQADDSIFAEAQASLQALLDKEKRKSTLVEQRTLQAEEGQHRLVQARLAAQALIYEKIRDLALQDNVGNFLTGYWLQALTFIHLRRGPSSAEWLAAEQTIVDLIWLCHEHEDSRSPSRRERMLPQLLDAIEAGLANILSDASERNAIVQDLEQTLQGISRQQLPTESFHAITDAQLDELGHGQQSPKSWNDMTPIERHMARHQELFNQYYVAAKDMPLGTWVESTDEVSGKQLRGKLTTKLDGDTYLFVNRLGAKVMEKTCKNLALDLQSQRVRVLDSRPMFDRIMTRLVGRLRENA